MAKNRTNMKPNQLKAINFQLKKLFWICKSNPTDFEPGFIWKKVSELKQAKDLLTNKQIKINPYERQRT
jgi:hypothetical protein